MEETSESVKLTKEQLAGLKKLREPFPHEQINKKPVPTKAQTEALKKDISSGIRCKMCGGWHHKSVTHIDYVGHAALTNRLLDADPLWFWEPFAADEIGTPLLDQYGGMWIWLYICGLKRRGYGDSGGKTGSNANKERIGDALRNAAMRLGAAVDLWSKSDLANVEEATEDEAEENKTIEGPANSPKNVSLWVGWMDKNRDAGCTAEQIESSFVDNIESQKASFSDEDYNELLDYKNDMIKEIQQGAI